MRMLTHTEFVGSVFSQHVNVVFSTVHSLPAFEDRLKVCLQELTAKGSIDDGTHSDQVQCLDPTSWVDVFEPIAVYLHTLVSRFRNALVETDLHSFVKEVHGMIDQWRSRFGDSSSPNARRMTESIELSLKLVQREEERARRADLRLDAIREDASADAVHSSAVASYHQAEQFDGPGVLSISGEARHDNDFENITDILIAPTSDEVLSGKSPYLPSNQRHAPHHLPDDTVARHLDIHFRLLREDFVHSIRESCWAWQQASAAVKASNRDRFFFHGSSSVFMYRNLALHAITIDKHQGVALMVEFDDIAQLRNKSKTDRKDFWKRSKRLQHGSLMCITWTMASGETRLAFAAIVLRDEAELAGSTTRDAQLSASSKAQGKAGGSESATEHVPLQMKRPRIGLGMLNEADRIEFLRMIFDPVASRNVIMLQTCDSFFSYRPILEGIQNIAQDALPLLQYIVRPHDGSVEMPAYVQERTTYDLSMLLDPEKMQGMAGWKSANPVKEVRLRDEESLAAATAFLRQHSMLDEAQLQAIMAALTQELVLIQGPPGTGKS
jgi:hypothetical protein